MRLTAALIFSMSIAFTACRPEEVDAVPQVPEGATEGVSDDETSCIFGEDAGIAAEQWQCRGSAAALVLQEDTVLWTEGYEFGDESYEDAKVIACCVTSGEVEPEASEVTLDMAPAYACLIDCAQQWCLSAVARVREEAEELPVGPRNQLLELSNWMASHQQDCVDAFFDDADIDGGGVRTAGVFEIPNSDDWPNFENLALSGNCEVSGWTVADEPLTCTGIGENDDESIGNILGGSGFLAGRRAVADVGRLRLQGPVISGVRAVGEAPLSADDPSVLKVYDSGQESVLQTFLVRGPAFLDVGAAETSIPIEGATVELVGQAWGTRKVLAEGSVRLDWPAGSFVVVASARVHKLPVVAVARNELPVRATIDAQSGRLELEPIVLVYIDENKRRWRLVVEVAEWTLE